MIDTDLGVLRVSFSDVSDGMRRLRGNASSITTCAFMCAAVAKVRADANRFGAVSYSERRRVAEMD